MVVRLVSLGLLKMDRFGGIPGMFAILAAGFLSLG
jgi:hypothetical protein